MTPNKRSNLARTLLILTLLLAGRTTALEACECVGKGSACHSATPSEGVFLGKAMSVSTFSEQMQIGPNQVVMIQKKRVIFQIAEHFNGSVAKVAEVITGTGGGDCGYPFKEGRDYLVYASHSPDDPTVLSTSICSGTAPVENAAADLSYLRSLANGGGPPARIYGYVTAHSPLIFTEMSLSDKAPHPMANVPVRLESGAASLKTLTDSAGVYTFDGLARGDFVVSAEMPNNLGGGEKRTIRLEDHACSEQNFVAAERAQITGRLLDDRLLPVATMNVVMVPVGSFNRADILSAYTDAKGVFTIKQLPPGNYLLGVNITEPPREDKFLSHPFPSTYYPGVANLADAGIIHVESAQDLSGFELRLLPPLKLRTITGRVTWPDGRPALGAYVELKDSAFQNSNVDLGHGGRNGEFTVTGVEGRVYSVLSEIGIGDGENPVHSETVQLKPDENGPVHLILSLPGRP